MKNTTKTLLAIIGILAGVLIVGINNQSNVIERAKCHHNGRLDNLNTNDTWRVDLTDWTTGHVEIGVCKRCGEVTDVKGYGSNWVSHFPVPTEEQKKQAVLNANREQLASQIIYGWTVSHDYTSTNKLVPLDIPDVIQRLNGIQNKTGRLLIIDTTNRVWKVAEFDLPGEGSTLIIQGDNNVTNNRMLVP